MPFDNPKLIFAVLRAISVTWAGTETPFSISVSSLCSRAQAIRSTAKATASSTGASGRGLGENHHSAPSTNKMPPAQPRALYRKTAASLRIINTPSFCKNFYTGSAKVSGCSGSNASLAHITVTISPAPTFSMLWV